MTGADIRKQSAWTSFMCATSLTMGVVMTVFSVIKHGCSEDKAISLAEIKSWANVVKVTGYGLPMSIYGIFFPNRAVQHPSYADLMYAASSEVCKRRSEEQRRALAL